MVFERRNAIFISKDPHPCMTNEHVPGGLALIHWPSLQYAMTVGACKATLLRHKCLDGISFLLEGIVLASKVAPAWQRVELARAKEVVRAACGCLVCFLVCGLCVWFFVAVF